MKNGTLSYNRPCIFQYLLGFPIRERHTGEVISPEDFIGNKSGELLLVVSCALAILI